MGLAMSDEGCMSSRGLIDRLPPLRGRLTPNADLRKMTWFRVGGPAEVLFRPADTEDLATLLRSGVPVTVLGVASNVLIRDGGIPGVVVRLVRALADIRVEGADIVAGAGALDSNVAKLAATAGISGLEFLIGVPGSIGGALRMNAGAYGRELADVLVEAHALDRQGRMHRLTPDDMGLSYRHSSVPSDWIFTGARLRGTPGGDPAEIAGRLAEIQAQREATQPIRTRTGGSTFKNPEGKRAWELIDAAGCRGLSHGGAQVSEKHCNFLINTGDATAADIEELGELVRQRVKDATGVTLEWEIKRIGVPMDREGDT